MNQHIKNYSLRDVPRSITFDVYGCRRWRNHFAPEWMINTPFRTKILLCALEIKTPEELAALVEENPMICWLKFPNFGKGAYQGIIDLLENHNLGKSPVIMKLIQINNSYVRADRVESVTCNFYPAEGDNEHIAEVSIRSFAGASFTESKSCHRGNSSKAKELEQWVYEKGQEIKNAILDAHKEAL